MNINFSRVLWGAASLAGFSATAALGSTTAVPASDFLDSIGANSAIAARGETLEKTMECAGYLGLRWFRAGVEGNVPVAQFIELHRQTGVRFSWGLGSGGSNISKLIETARPLAEAGALLAFEGPNEPNNWDITYDGQGGGRNQSWLPVAKLQAALYQAVKSDPVLKSFPVWSITEGGAETDNVGLQFLKIPEGAGTLLPPGTRFADFANVHNYIYHPNAPGLEDNKTWKASEPTSVCKVDGLFGEYGRTWARHYAGYFEKDLLTLPRVTTETGCLIAGAVTEETQALNLLTLYLDQFKRGWSFTAVYLLRDRVDEAGNQSFGFYRRDYTPRKAALYLHNLTTLLADRGRNGKPGALDYSIPNEPDTVHDLLLQKSDGTFELVIWGERLKGASDVQVNFSNPRAAVTIYDPITGILPVKTLTHIRSLPLSLSDHPLVVELRN